MAELDLEKIRQKIDIVDNQLAKVLEDRLALVMEVAKYKKTKGIAVKDETREAKVIEKVTSLLKNKEYTSAVRNIMRSIIDAACVLEENLIVEKKEKLQLACFGALGSFTHQALEEYFGNCQYVSNYFNTFEEVIASIDKNLADYGILPIENSSTGGITEVYDLLGKYNCHIVGEKYLKIEQNLLACKGATLDSIKKVYSHPQGLMQSKEFFKDYPNIETIPYFSTSKSAEVVAHNQDLTLAAVAGKKAATLYGLEVLAKNINYNSKNSTRFVVIAKNELNNPSADKLTLIVAVKHEAGSLYKILGSFYKHGLNLINLESRPQIGKSWEYFFHIDVTGNIADDDVQAALTDVAENCTYYKILGNYLSDKRKE